MKKFIQANILNIVTALFVLSLLSVFYFSGYSPTEADQSGTPDTIGEQKTLVALFNYADYQSKPITLDQVKNRLMYDTQSVNAFVKENSYDKAWLNPTFFDWRPLPSSAADYHDHYQLFEAAVKDLDDEVYFPDYKRFIFIFLNNYKALHYEGVTIGTALVSNDTDSYTEEASIINASGAGLVSLDHELGHQFGFAHASTFVTNGIPVDLTDLSDLTHGWIIGDDYDNMGGGPNQWSTISKYKAGWLDPSQVQVVTQSAEFDLDQVELPSNGLKTLKIPLGKRDTAYQEPLDNEANYFVEYRKPLGLFDGTRDAVQVRFNGSHLGYNAKWEIDSFRFMRNYSGTVGYDEYMDANIDQPFIDPYRGIKIELLEKTGEGADSKARVRVTFSGVDISPPGYLLNFKEWQENPRTLTVSNNTGVPLDVGRITIADTAGKKDSSSFEIAADNVSNKTIPIGAQVTFKVHFIPTNSSGKIAYINIPTNNDLRPNAVVSLSAADTNGPKAPKLYAPLISTTASKTTGFSVSWSSVTDSFSTITGYQLQYHPHTTEAWSTCKIDGQEWTKKTKTTFVGKPGYTYEFRVRAIDNAQNTSWWGWGNTIVPYDDRSFTYSSNWHSATNAYSYKNTLKYTGVTNSYSTFTISYANDYEQYSSRLILIAPKGPYKGKMNVYIRDKVNGVWTKYVKIEDIDESWQPSIDLYSSTYKNRVPIYINTWEDKTWNSALIHQIKFVTTGTKNPSSKGTRVDIDGLAISRMGMNWPH
jgi:hypothetical protein